ncbi:B-cell receptor CD22-like isoform X2 [Alosa sapidissima]|uniref:B-cell receptor CD22-like isoform X2 n=1 Tax=Alosa sapidissima TaxID=34773 RepID=UPI001C08C828|nr:B-cell receptor CD22-like isoform X2 [Alosa sapidissima]
MQFTKGPVILTAVFCLLSGVFGQSYRVTNPSTSICGLKKSSVDIPCTYSYPRNRKIIQAFWHIKMTGTKDAGDLSLDTRYQGRVEYLGDKVNNCTLRVKDLRESDTVEKYKFRFITDDPKGKLAGSEVSLTLTDLHVKVSPKSVNKGDRVTLTCSTTCSLSKNPTYIWYRDSQPLSNSHTTGSNTLSIPSFRTEDAGGYYSCAVRGHEAHPSPSVCILSGWSVTSTPQSICALKGSSVELHSYYTYPCDHAVTKAYWITMWGKAKENPPDLKLEEHYQGRAIYTENNKNSQTLRIGNLSLGDSNSYQFRFITDKGGKYSGLTVGLTVTELQLLVNSATVKEGDRVTLTCSTTCSLSNNPTYIWYRNSQPVNNLHRADNRLDIDSVSIEDAGKYSCAVKGHGIHSSPELILNVRYTPRNTLGSVHPSVEPVEGSSVTLTCSSDANRTAHTFTWYRKHRSESTWLGQGWSYSITNISTKHSGLYYCKGENKHGASDSSATFVDVHYSPRMTSASLIPSGDLYEGDSVTLTCSSDANPPVHTYTWYRKTGDETVLQGTGRMPNLTFNLVPGVDGLYHCKAQNKVGLKNSTGVRVSLPGVIGGMLAVVAGVLTGVAVHKRVTQTREMSGTSTAAVRDTTAGPQAVQPGPADDPYTGLKPHHQIP